MSERLPEHENNERLGSPETSVEKEPKQVEQQPERKAEKKIDIEAIHKEIEKDAKSAKEIKIDEEVGEKNDAEHYIATRELKQEALKRSLQRTRKHMSTTSRAFSKVIHQPVVDTISKVGEKTIARPTGILTGAIVALIGSSYLLYTAKHYGFQYNYLVVLLLLGGGYLVGLVIEFLIYSFRKLARKG